MLEIAPCAWFGAEGNSGIWEINDSKNNEYAGVPSPSPSECGEVGGFRPSKQCEKNFCLPTRTLEARSSVDSH